MGFAKSMFEGEAAAKDGKTLEDNPYRKDKPANSFDAWNAKEFGDWWEIGFNNYRKEEK